MSSLEIQLLNLYFKLACGVLLGLVLGWTLPKVAPAYLGKFLFWVGVPISIVAFLRGSDLSGSIWIAPAAAWAAILLGVGLAWAWIEIEGGKEKGEGIRNKKEGGKKSWSGFALSFVPSFVTPLAQKTRSKPTQGSFILAAMVGNTGYLGYPVTLALVGEKYFAWALFYDMLGSLLGAYGLGVILAARFGRGEQNNWHLALAMVQNPTLWSFGFGLAFRDVPLWPLAEQSLQAFAWTILTLSLVLIGMRLSQLSSWRSLQLASVSLGIKMLLVPLIVGVGLSLLGVTGPAHLAIVLQMAMPPAFATLVLAEAYNLDRDLAVTSLGVGCIVLLLTLPIWLWLFGV